MWNIIITIVISGHTQIMATGFEGTESNVGVIAIGLYNGMWAYSGWWVVTYFLYIF